MVYSGSWIGAYGDLGGIQSWGHDGSYSIVVDRGGQDTWAVSANAMKSDGGPQTLTISIREMDGTVLKTASTSTAYGMAQVTVIVE